MASQVPPTQPPAPEGENSSVPLDSLQAAHRGVARAGQTGTVWKDCHGPWMETSACVVLASAASLENVLGPLHQELSEEYETLDVPVSYSSTHRQEIKCYSPNVEKGLK